MSVLYNVCILHKPLITKRGKSCFLKKIKIFGMVEHKHPSRISATMIEY